MGMKALWIFCLASLAAAVPARAHPGVGIVVDRGGNVYVAVFGTRAIVRVGASGRVATVARTPAPWAPSGVTLAPDGDLWILEYSTSNQARVRRIDARGRGTTYRGGGEL